MLNRDPFGSILVIYEFLTHFAVFGASSAPGSEGKDGSNSIGCSVSESCKLYLLAAMR